MRQTCDAGCFLPPFFFRVLLAVAFLLTACQSQPEPVEPTVSVESAATAAGAQPARSEPQPPIRQEWNFAAAGNALGWKPTNDLAPFTFDSEGLRTSAAGGDPYLVGPSTSVEAAAAYYVEVRMRSTQGSDAQLFWSPGGEPFSEPASLHFEVTPDGGWHTYQIPVKTSSNWTGNITRLRLDPTSQPGGEIGIAFIRILGPAPARVAVSRFAPPTAFASDGRPFDVQAVLRNAGDAPSAEAEYQLDLPAGLSLASGPLTREAGAIAPGDDLTLTWPLQGAAGVYALRLLQAQNEIGQTNAIVESQDAHESAALAGDQIRLSFPHQPFGYGVGTLEYGDAGDWRIAGRLQSLGEIVYADAAGQAHSALLYAQSVLTEPHSLRFTAAVTDVDGVVWQSQVDFELAQGAATPFISVTSTLTADRDVRLLAWRGPRYLPGEGSFGEVRDSALFPGLEYLLADDQSSSERYVAAPLNRRYVPHPNKITIPLMAVTRDELTTGLMWDPLQLWDGVHDRPAALFASPNTWDGQSNHLMELFVPGMTAGLAENAGQLEQPYALAANAALNLNALLFAAAAPESVTPVQLWLERFGLPGLPAAPRPEVDTLKSALDNYQNVVWVAASGGWRYALHDPWGPGYNPGVALHLWLATLDPELKTTTPVEWRDTVRSTLDTPPVGGQPNPWYYQPTFLLNQVAPGASGLAETLARMQVARQSAFSAVTGQRDDGSWGYSQANAATPRFGEEGDTSNGYTAARAFQILYQARITGDSRLAESGLKALSYLERQPLRPEGAQTWELSLHVPDLLASAWVAQSFVEGYRLTGEDRYLDQAQRWALAGLPFVYLWNAPDREVMRFGTIPVFGASNYTSPWFGRPVMWNGLDYAIGLQSLAAELKAAGVPSRVDWRRVAEGIAVATAQMQSQDPAFRGMYPDAWDVVAGSEAYTWWLAPTYLMQNVELLRGVAGAQIQTRIVEVNGKRVHVNAVSALESVESDSGKLSVKLQTYPGETTALMLSAVPGPPVEVLVGGQPVAPSEWSYGQGVVLVRATADSRGNAHVDVAFR